MMALSAPLTVRARSHRGGLLLPAIDSVAGCDRLPTARAGFRATDFSFHRAQSRTFDPRSRRPQRDNCSAQYPIDPSTFTARTIGYGLVARRFAVGRAGHQPLLTFFQCCHHIRPGGRLHQSYPSFREHRVPSRATFNSRKTPHCAGRRWKCSRIHHS